MFRLEWLFLMQLAMGVLMIVFLQRLTQMKKQVDEITKEVTNYVSYITEEMEGEQNAFSAREGEKQAENTVKIQSKREKEEAQNQLIQAVLGEYFS